MRVAPDAPARGAAFRFALRLGLISFGGPAGQIAILHRELVAGRGWIGDAEFARALNFCMLLPGPEALQLVIWLGWRWFGIDGLERPPRPNVEAWFKRLSQREAFKKSVLLPLN